LNDSTNQKITNKYFQSVNTQNGKHVFKTSMGMALSYLPFFTSAHVYAKLFNYETNGYSKPYHFAIQFSSLFYYIIGLIFLMKILQLYFKNSLVALVLFTITFGTNVLFYLTVGGGMSHALSFSLIAAFIYFTIHWHKTPTFKYSLLIGLIGGYLTLIRPINILAFVLFFLYDVKSIEDIIQKLKLLYQNKFKLIIIALLGVLTFLPQLLYWKYQTGHWFFNSYIGERFYFNNPHIFYGLFSFRKGWLLYTPIMVFALMGIYNLYKLKKEFFYPTLVLLVLYIYLAFSWWSWWYGGSYGQRALIDLYPVLAIPLAFFLFKVQSLNNIKKNIFYFTFASLILLNVFQTMQAKWNTIHFDSMTKEAYFDAFLRLTKNPEREKFLKHPDYEKAKAGLEEY
jgi:hypothetical protein